jgi:hypothetical protein
VVYVDETGVRVDGVRHWTWAFTTGSETLIAIRRSRFSWRVKLIAHRYTFPIDTIR